MIGFVLTYTQDDVNIDIYMNLLLGIGSTE